MKKVFLSICFVIAAVSFVSAQQGGGGDQADRIARMKQRLKDELKLTDVQIDTVISIQQVFQPRTREIRMDQAMSDADKQAKMKAISDERNKRFETSLGKDLAAKLTEYYSKMQQNRGGGGGSPQQ
ncbi:MAG: hypothetical protein JWQ40_319 [Segetibacter sp.]|nr:hypothetical protein [Segetibacter sp.]